MKWKSMPIAIAFVAGVTLSAGAGTPQTPSAGKEPETATSATAGPHGATPSNDCPMHAGAMKAQGATGEARGMGQGCQRRGRGAGMRGRDENHAADRDTIHALLGDHKKITRKSEELPNGVRTETTSSDPKVAALIQEHVGRMQDRMEEGAPIRMHDPLFVELFKHHDKVAMKVEAIEGGVRVTETSDDPQVVLLIKQHARRGIDEFIARGFERAPEPTPLPEGYKTE